MPPIVSFGTANGQSTIIITPSAGGAPAQVVVPRLLIALPSIVPSATPVGIPVVSGPFRQHGGFKDASAHPDGRQRAARALVMRPSRWLPAFPLKAEFHYASWKLCAGRRHVRRRGYMPKNAFDLADKSNHTGAILPCRLKYSNAGASDEASD